MKPTIYIAGPMRGRPDSNRAAFNAAAERLAAKGWQPVNPVDIEKIYPCVEEDGSVNTFNLGYLMGIESEFARRSDAIYLLDGWETSYGAQSELHDFISFCKHEVYLESNGTPDARGERSGAK